MNPLEMGVHARWSSRPSTLDEAADLLVGLHDRLAEVGSPFDSLFEVTRKGKVPWSGDLDFARASLLRGRNWNDLRPRRLIPELGFMVGYDEKQGRWNAGVWLAVGATTGGYANFANIDLPSGIGHETGTVKLLRTILDICIDELNPDWAKISSNAVLPLINDRTIPEPELGWFLYLAEAELAGRPPLPTLPAPARADLHKSGVLIRLTEEWFDPESQAHASVFQAVDNRLRSTGFLRPSGSRES